MFDEITIAKVTYDLAIAILTGVGTGFFVNYLISRREEARVHPTRTLVYVNLADIVKTILTAGLSTLTFYERTTKLCKFSAIAIASLLVELKDKNLFIYGSDSQARFIKIVCDYSFSSRSEEGKVTREADSLRVAKQRLEGVFTAFSSVIEPELMTMVGELHDYLNKTIDFIDSKVNWEIDQTKQSYAISLLSLFESAEKLRCKIYSYGTIFDIADVRLV